MNTRLLLSAILLAPAISMAMSKNIKSIDQSHTPGLMGKISCKYSGRNNSSASVGSYDFNSVDSKNVVCDPLSGSTATSSDQGLLGRIILRTSDMGSTVNSVISYLNQGNWLDQKVYFSSVNVPTRDFTKGFTTQNGDVLTDENGNKLIKDFAIEYTSVLQLSSSDKEGEYEIALLSDDGARMFILENNTWNEVINNDGDHATRMGCPYRTIHMDKNSQIPMKIAYYQGPGTSLANVMIWRRVAKAHTWKNPDNHSLCGYQGDSYFFNKNGGIAVGMLWLQLEGWNVVAPANFKMPAQTANPCVTLSISNFAVASSDSSSAVLNWTTNLPASSQLTITNFFTGEQITTPYDSNLVTSHTVTVSGLVSGSVYKVQAISNDGKGHTVTSDAITLVIN